MKKSFFLLSALSLAIACNSVGDDEYVLTGTIKGVDTGKNVILERNTDSTGVVSVDTVQVKDGKFRFEGKITEAEMHSISVEGVNEKSYVILENGEINIDINKDTIFLNKVTGTENNEYLTEFNEMSMGVYKKVQAFQERNKDRIMAAQATKDTAAMQKLRKEYEVIQKQMEANTYKFIEEHPNALLSGLLVQSMFNVIDPDLGKIEKYYNGFGPELKKNKVGKNIAKRLNDFKVVQPGRRAPEFTAPDPNGKMVSLKESLGKVTILDFWASWCGPCRKANPELVKLYNELHGKGLNIISYSLDKPGEGDRWKEAIAKDGLIWTNVSNLKHWEDPIVKLYGFDAIPAMYLLNEHGVVMAKDLHGEQLRAKVLEFLTGIPGGGAVSTK